MSYVSKIDDELCSLISDGYETAKDFDSNPSNDYYQEKARTWIGRATGYVASLAAAFGNAALSNGLRDVASGDVSTAKVHGALAYLESVRASLPALADGRKAQAATAPAAAGAAGSGPRTWQYRTLEATDPRTPSPTSSLDSDLQGHGEQGWELVAAVPIAWNDDRTRTERYRLFFKRPTG